MSRPSGVEIQDQEGKSPDRSDPDADDTIASNPNVIQPNRRWIVEPACLLFCIGLFSQFPVVTQFVYYRVGLQYNTTYNSSRAFVCNKNSLANASEHELTKKIQSEASSWTLYRSTVSSVVALVVLPIYASASDFLGRKPVMLLPALGLAVDAIGLLMVVLIDLPLTGLVVSGGLGALGGGFATMFAGVFAYIADTTSRKQRPIRIAVVELMFGVAGAVMELVMGWWIKLMGYTVPLIFSAAVIVANAAYIFFLVPEVRRRLSDAKTLATSWHRLALLPVTNIISLFRTDNRLSVILGLLLASMGTFSFSFMGSNTVASLYQMNYPFCMDSVNMGYLSAAKIVGYQIGAVIGLIGLRKYLGVKTIVLILLGLASSGLGSLTTGLAPSTAVLYVAAGVAMFSMLSIPMFRAYSSQLAPPERQGALFSCIGVLEVAGSLAGSAAFTVVYRDSLSWMPGFVFVVASMVTAGSLLLSAACYLVERFLWPPAAAGMVNVAEQEFSVNESEDDGNQILN